MADFVEELDRVIDECIATVKRVQGVARRVEFVQGNDSAYGVSLVLCPQHLEVFLEQHPQCHLTGETFLPAQCDWCHPEES